jgi:hypothetical protein
MKLTQVEAARLMAAHEKAVDAAVNLAEMPASHLPLLPRKRAAERAFAELVAQLTDSEGL